MIKVLYQDCFRTLVGMTQGDGSSVSQRENDTEEPSPCVDIGVEYT